MNLDYLPGDNGSIQFVPDKFVSVVSAAKC